MKQCNTCQEWKKLEEYHKDSSKKSGRRGICKMCWNEKKKTHWNNYVIKHGQPKKSKYTPYQRILRKINGKVKDLLRQIRTCKDCGEKFIYGYGKLYCDICTRQRRLTLYKRMNQKNRESGYSRIKRHERRAREKTTPEQRRLILDWVKEVKSKRKFTCYYCQQRKSIKQLEIDHVKPLSKGGKNIISNLVTACNSCNASKCAKDVTEWSMGNAQPVLL